MPAMAMNFAGDNGECNPRYIAYMAARAAGGAGIVLTEGSHVKPNGRIFPRSLGIYDDSLLPGLKELTEKAHAAGGKIGIQLNHSGRQGSSRFTGEPIVSCSPIPCPRRREMPCELTVPEIEEIIRDFGEGAKRAKEAGFDMIEIHGAHGYLINQFLSPYSNLRRDEYGGDPERRMRFALEVVEAVRKAVGKDYPVSFRISVDEFVPNGLTLDTSIEICKRLEEMGVDLLNVTGSVYGSVHMMIAPMQLPQNLLVYLAGEVKKHVNIPVAGVGRIVDPDKAEEAIANGETDLVALGRALIADPEWPNKVKENRISEISRCVACVQGCVGPHLVTTGAKCLQNPGVGREYKEEKPAGRKKEIMVIGAGPAGLEFAVTAAARGHKVEIYEAKERIGGTFNLAAVPPGKDEIRNVVEIRKTKLDQLNVPVHCNIKADVPLILKNKPDAVVLALGAEPRRLNIPGCDRENVYQANQILEMDQAPGRIIAIIGGGMVGCETALHLAKQGKQVTIIEMMDDIATDINERMRYVVLQEIEKAGIDVITGVKVDSFIDFGVQLFRNNHKRLIEADTIVVAIGSVSNNDLYEEVKKIVPECCQIGDCKEPKSGLEAIEQGFLLGEEI